MSHVEELDWTQPCPPPIRCPIQTYCPAACRAAGNREGNKPKDDA